MNHIGWLFLPDFHSAIAFQNSVHITSTVISVRLNPKRFICVEGTNSVVFVMFMALPPGY